MLKWVLSIRLSKNSKENTRKCSQRFFLSRYSWCLAIKSRVDFFMEFTVRCKKTQHWKYLNFFHTDCGARSTESRVFTPKFNVEMRSSQNLLVNNFYLWINIIFCICFTDYHSNFENVYIFLSTYNKRGETYHERVHRETDWMKIRLVRALKLYNIEALMKRWQRIR